MAKGIRRQVNFSDTAVLSDPIQLNASTSTMIADSNMGRIFFRIDNSSNNAIWIKLQAASVDDIKKGIFIGARSWWQMPVDNMYSGEISAIADLNNPQIHTTEY